MVFPIGKEPFIASYLGLYRIFHLTFKFLNCSFFFYVEGRICPTPPFLWKVPQTSRIYFLCSGAPMLRAEGREGLLCAMFTFGCWCWERKEVDRCGCVIFLSNHLTFRFVVFFLKRMENWIGSWKVWWRNCEGCFWMRRMVRVEWWNN